MEIKKLKIYSNNIDQQEHFYKTIMGFSTLRINDSLLKVQAGSTELFLEASSKKSFYHFAFLIPNNTLYEAIAFMESRSIPLLPYNDSKIIYFANGTAIYFYDADGNIVEFIERPLLEYSTKEEFSINSIVKINEIGLVVSNPSYTKEQLINKFGVNPTVNAPMKDDFCWLGDHNGAIIVTKEGRHWLPTQIPGTFNDFTINYTDRGKEHHLSFEKDAIINV